MRPSFLTVHIQAVRGALVVVMLALGWHDWEPGCVSAVVVDQVLGTDPAELVALVQAERGHPWLVPPVLLLHAATASPGVVGGRDRGRALTRINLEALVRCDEGHMGPVDLHPPALCGPVIAIPYGTVNPHGLILGERYSPVLEVGVNPNRGLIH